MPAAVKDDDSQIRRKKQKKFLGLFPVGGKKSSDSVGHKSGAVVSATPPPKNMVVVTSYGAAGGGTQNQQKNQQQQSTPQQQQQQRKVRLPEDTSGAAAVVAAAVAAAKAKAAAAAAGDGTSVASTSSASKDKGRELFSTFGRWLTKTRLFRNMCDSVFESIDADGSGAIDEKELYSGLLLVHLKLGMYAGPPACSRPLTRQQCVDMFKKFDVDGNGELSKDEFRRLMILLFPNVFVRVLVVWTATIMLVPFVANSVLRAISFCMAKTEHAFYSLDDHSPWIYWSEIVAMASMHLCTSMMVQYLVPQSVLMAWRKTGRMYHYVISFIPEAILNILPYTLISTVLSVVAIPWLLMQIDNYFNKKAEMKSRKLKSMLVQAHHQSKRPKQSGQQQMGASSTHSSKGKSIRS